MANYFQCPHCGAPNDSEERCSYCENHFTKEVILSLSKTDKSIFDLGIYELREGRTWDAKKIFDSILIKDSQNRLALFYKYIIEISLGNDLNKISQRLTELNYFKVDYLLAIDLFEGLEGYLSSNDTILTDNFILYIEMLPIDTRIMFLEVMLKRYSNGLSIEGRILNELEILLSHKELFLLNENVTVRLVNQIKEGFSSTLEILQKSIGLKKKILLRNSQLSESPLSENEILAGYLNKEYKFIEFLKTCTFLNTIPQIVFEKYIEDCEKKDDQIRNSVIDTGNSVIDTGAENKKPNACFIATATMGSYDHPVVIDLREFRDTWLLKRHWGVVFTDWYYRHGPKAAVIIFNSFLLKKISFIIIVKPLHFFSKIIAGVNIPKKQKV